MKIISPVFPSPLRTTSSSSAKVRALLAAMANSAISGWPTAALSAARTALNGLEDTTLNRSISTLLVIIIFLSFIDIATAIHLVPPQYLHRLREATRNANVLLAIPFTITCSAFSPAAVSSRSGYNASHISLLGDSSTSIVGVARWKRCERPLLIACSANRSRRHPRRRTTGRCLGQKGRGSGIQPRVP